MDKVTINTNVPLDQFGQNANIKCEKSLEELIAIGMIPGHDKESVYMMRNLGNQITFNIRINKNKDVVIQVIDEESLQPYDYQKIMEHPQSRVALDIHTQVQQVMKRLGQWGVIVGYNENDYI